MDKLKKVAKRHPHKHTPTLQASLKGDRVRPNFGSKASARKLGRKKA